MKCSEGVLPHAHLNGRNSIFSSLHGPWVWLQPLKYGGDFELICASQNFIKDVNCREHRRRPP